MQVRRSRHFFNRFLFFHTGPRLSWPRPSIKLLTHQVLFESLDKPACRWFTPSGGLWFKPDQESKALKKHHKWRRTGIYRNMSPPNRVFRSSPHSYVSSTKIGRASQQWCYYPRSRKILAWSPVGGWGGSEHCTLLQAKARWENMSVVFPADTSWPSYDWCTSWPWIGWAM